MYQRDRDRFADALREHLDRTVVDRTGLTGPSVFTAVQEDLGLRLEPGKGPVETFVIDSAAKASAN
jgi:hypothetical protein